MRLAKYLWKSGRGHALLILLLGITTNQLTAQCTIACHDQVNVGLDNTCLATITYNMILQGEDDPLNCAPNTPESFSISLSQTRGGAPLPNSPMVSSDDLGKLYYATVTHLPTGTNCTGTIIVDDDSPPTIECPQDATILCGAPSDTMTLGMPLIFDCNDFEVSFSDFEENLSGACTGLAGKIARTWRVLSANGKRAECLQTIEITRPDINDLVFPPNRNGIDAPSVSCDAVDLSIESTGAPSFDGIPIDLRNGLCGYSTTFRDFVAENDGINQTIIRTWVVIDPCSEQVLRQDQTIIVRDTELPVIDCPAVLSVGTTEIIECSSTFRMPAVPISDNCSTDFSVVIQTPVNDVQGNGGLVERLPIGEHILTYLATDQSGRVGSCQTTVTVTDKTAPALTCEDRITISLSDAGAGRIFPTSMVIDAEDNCCNNVTLDLRRMNVTGNTDYFESLVVDCSDVGQSLLFLNRGTDCNGNSNVCMVRVDVVDNSSTTEIVCPEDVTVDCTIDFDDPFLTGLPDIIGFCNVPSAQADFVDQEDLDACGTGTILRTWSLNIETDGNGSCTQTIVVRDPSPINIRFPDDLDLNTCISPNDLQPDDLEAPFNLPVVTGASTCNDVSVTFEDLPIISENGNCIVIRRVWTVTENCVFDPNNPNAGGRTQYTQRININETTPPIIECPPTITVDTGNDCVVNVFIDGITVTGECLPSEVALTVVGDLGNGRFFTDVAPGIYEMNAEAQDRCGNRADCDFTVRVVENVDPVANCQIQVVANIEADETVTVFAESLNDNSTDNCTNADDLELRIGPVPAPGTTTPPANIPLTFICENVGTTAPVALWVGDESGNWAFCTTNLQITDPESNCSANIATAIVAGTIQAMNGSMVDQVDISLEGMDMPAITTDASGQFRFTDLATDASYRLRAKRETSFKEGLSTIDIIHLVQHITKRNPLTDPYTQIAADVNGDNRISILDVIALQKLIINVQQDIDTNEPWRFVPKDFIFPDPLDIFDNGFPEFKDIRGLQEDYWSADFIAIKVGDINQSFYPDKSQAQVLENRSGRTLDLVLIDQSFAAGEVFTVELTTTTKEETLQALQLALDIDKDLEVLAIHSDQFEQNLLYHQDEIEGLLLSAFDAKAANENKSLLSLELRAHRAGKLSDFIKMKDAGFQAEAVLVTGQVLQQLNLTFVPEGNLALRIVPNPFTEKTQLSITSAQEEWIQYQIWNSNGQLVAQNKWHKQVGTERLDLHAHQLDGPGLYYLKIISPTETQVLKMIKH